MDFYTSLINMQTRTRMAFRLYRTIDLAVLCVLAREPRRVFSYNDIAASLDVAYQTAWNAVRRLELNRVVEVSKEAGGCRLTPEGVELARVDQPHASFSPAAASATRAPETPPPVDADQIF